MVQLSEQSCSPADVKWWKTSRSLREIAEHLERAVKEKQDLERRFVDLLQENIKLSLRCAKADAEVTSERVRRSTEVASLRVQLSENEKQTKIKPAGEGKQQAELAAREKLIKDEFERKIQTLQLESKRERHQLANRVEKMKAELANCICRGNAGQTYAEGNQRAHPKSLRYSDSR